MTSTGAWHSIHDGALGGSPVATPPQTTATAMTIAMSAYYVRLLSVWALGVPFGA